MQPLAWDDFRLVQAIAEHLSLSGAANALGLNHSTVFRRLNALEEQLGVRIFERARSGYQLTSAGEEMVALAARMAESIVNFERRIAGQDVRPSGELRVTTTDTIFSHLVAPMFCTFRQRFPDIALDFIIENRTLNLSRRDADVAIRASVEPPETLVGRRVAQIAWSAYAARRLIDEGDIDPHGGGILTKPPARWLGFSERLTDIPPARWLTKHVDPACIGVKLNSVASHHGAIAAGLGIGLIPCFIGDKSPGLVRLRQFTPTPGASLWVLTHPDMKKAARVRAFLDFFSAELAKKRKFIEGEDD